MSDFPYAPIARDGSEAFMWIVPARVEGRWTIRDERGFWEGDVEFAQRFQRLGGTVTIRGKAQPLLGAYVQGEAVGYTFVRADGGVHSVRARVAGDALSGPLHFAGSATPITGRPR